MRKTIIHLSHTDINFDSRIQKEISSLTKTKLFNIFSLGISSNNIFSSKKINKFHKNYSVCLLTKKLRISRNIKYIFNLIEFSLYIIFYGLKIRPSLIHCHDTLALLPATILKLILGSKLIYDAHELESNKNMQNIILSKATFLIEKICWIHINILISVSDSIILWYKKKFGFKESILILNSPTISIFNSKSLDKNNLRKIFKINKNELIFIYVGDFCLGRGIDLLLDVFSKDNFKPHIVFLGNGFLEKKIKSFSITNSNIHLHRKVPHNQVVNLIKSADIGICIIENVSLSDYYCLPNKLFEYSFAGLTIIGSDLPEISNYILRNNIGKVCKVNFESINNAIKNIEKNGYNKISSNLSNFSWERQATKLINLYKKELLIK